MGSISPVMMATFCSLPMITLDDFPSPRDCGWQPVLAVEDLEVFGGTAEWPPSGRHSSRSRKNEGADQDFSATASADSLTNSARRRGTAKSTKARTFGTDMRPCGTRRLTGMAEGSASRSRSSNDPLWTRSAT